MENKDNLNEIISTLDTMFSLNNIVLANAIASVDNLRKSSTAYDLVTLINNAVVALEEIARAELAREEEGN
jgi:hypothetical protein